MFEKKIKKVFKVDGMHCEHCANTVKEALTKIGASKVKVNLDKKEVIMYSNDEIDNELIKNTINELEFKYIGE